MIDSLHEAVTAAVKRPEVLAAIGEVYADVQTAVDQRRPGCEVSGRCCRFEEYGHRLYVTTVELAAFVAGLREAPRANWDGTGCPFQRNRLCTVHAIRPFGCRMFFCDPTSTDWQKELYERFHTRLKELHERLGIPYFYVEWRRALTELGVATGVSEGQTSF